jgi:hypothetical protein
VELPGEWVDELREAFADREDIAAAYWVRVTYPDARGVKVQHELHLELTDPPGPDGAPIDLFREVSRIMPGLDGGLIFTFPPAERLPAVRRAGLRVI